MARSPIFPASEVEVVIDPEPPHRLRVRGSVRERMFYGPKLVLEAEISTIPGSNAFQLTDLIINEGEDEQEFQIIYHANFGPPLLEEGSTFSGHAPTGHPVQRACRQRCRIIWRVSSSTTRIH